MRTWFSPGRSRARRYLPDRGTGGRDGRPAAAARPEPWTLPRIAPAVAHHPDR